MAGAQREAARPRPAGPKAASVGLHLWFVPLLSCALPAASVTQAWGEQAASVTGSAKRPVEQQPRGRKRVPASGAPARQTTPGARDAQPRAKKTTRSVRLPEPARSDGDKVTNTDGLRSGSKIEEMTANPVHEEPVTAPVAPEPFVPAAAPTPVAPPEKPVVPVEKPAAPMDAPFLPVEEPDTLAEKPSVTAAKLAATAAKLAAIAAKLAATAARLAATATQAGATESSRPAPGESPAAATAPTERTEPTAAPTAMEPVPPSKTGPAAPAKPDTVTLDEAVFDQIRLEIKSRLPYFQTCADAARRRGSSEVRRVQATWTIAADGAIKEMKVENVPDPQLAACIARIGSRPFPVKPGTELTIPTPIVFVR
jgi:hypothetical protein